MLQKDTYLELSDDDFIYKSKLTTNSQSFRKKTLWQTSPNTN